MAIENENPTRREQQVDDDREDDRGSEPDVQVEQRDGRTEVEVSGLSRRERRKQEREKEINAAVEAATKPLLEQFSQLQRSMAEMASRPQVQYQPPAAPQAGARQIDPEVRRIRARQEDIVALVKNSQQQLTPQRLQELSDEYTELDQSLIDHRARAIVEAERRNAPPAEPAEFNVIRREFNDVFGNPGATRLAQSIFTQLQDRALREQQRSGKAFNEMDLHRQALQQAGVEYGLRRPGIPPADPKQAARFGGSPPAGGGGGGGPARYSLSNEEKAVARGYAEMNEIPPEKAESEWVKAVLRSDPGYFGEISNR